MSTKKDKKSKKTEEAKLQIALQKENKELRNHDLFVKKYLQKKTKDMTIEELYAENKELKLKIDKQEFEDNIKRMLSESLLSGETHNVVDFFYTRRRDFDENLPYYLNLFHDLPACSEKKESFRILIDMLSTSLTKSPTKVHFYIEYHHTYPNYVDMKFTKFQLI